MLSFTALRHAGPAVAFVWLVVALVIQRPLIAVVPALVVGLIVYRGALVPSRQGAPAPSGTLTTRPSRESSAPAKSVVAAPMLARRGRKAPLGPPHGPDGRITSPDTARQTSVASVTLGDTIRARARAILRAHDDGDRLAEPIDINVALGTVAHRLAFEISNRELFAFLEEHSRRQQTDGSHEAFYREHGVTPDEREAIVPVLGLVLFTAVMTDLKREGESIDAIAMLRYLHPMVLAKSLGLRGAERHQALREEAEGPVAATIRTYQAIFADDPGNVIDATHRELIEVWWRAVDRYLATGDEPWIDVMTSAYPTFVRGVYRPAVTTTPSAPSRSR